MASRQGFYSTAMLHTSFLLPNIPTVLYGVVGTLAGIDPCILHFRKMYSCFHGAKAPRGPGPPHYRGFTITETPRTVGLLWTSDQPVAETST
jgi:hypothetical protein